MRARHCASAVGPSGGITARFGPFVVLFGQDCADEADQGVAVGEDPDDVGQLTGVLAVYVNLCGVHDTEMLNWLSLPNYFGCQ